MMEGKEGNKKLIGVWISPNVVIKLKIIKMKGKPISSVVEKALEEYFKKLEI